jgi:hypothetical protein
VIFCGLSLTKECILFIGIRQRRCKNKITAKFETYCHLNVACAGRQGAIERSPLRGF